MGDYDTYIRDKRRHALLKAIPAHDLRMMRERHGIRDGWLDAVPLRGRILEHWGEYADEIRRWVEFAITGEHVLEPKGYCDDEGPTLRETDR